MQHSIVGLGRSVMDIPPLVHREQARQHGDERLPSPGDIMDLPEIPPLLSTRQKRHGLPPCFTAEWASADLPRHSRLTAAGVPKRVRPGRRRRFRMDPVHGTAMARYRARLGQCSRRDPDMACDGSDCSFHRQFDSEQLVPLDPVNLDGFLRASARGDNRWCPDELAYWYGFWRNRMSRDHQIQIVPTRHPGWPSREYIDWWTVACRQRFLTQDRLLQDPRGVQVPGDVPPAASQERDPLVLPCDAPARDDGRGCSALISGGRVRTRPAVGGWIRSRAETMRTRRRSTLDGRRFRRGMGTRIRGETAPRHTTSTSTSSPVRMSRWLGSWSMEGAPDQDPGRNTSTGGGGLSDMYELFSCGEQTMDQMAHGYVASRANNDAVYRPSPPLQPHPDHSQSCQGFQSYQPSPQSFFHPSPQQQYQLPSPHCQTYYQPSPQTSYQSPSWAQ
ncbi:hypothetical protein PIB30_045221 [Stylosanthes scabra]|uniref:Aminotransferase-like plant mobile domain-containing protein n=1 Tax=Stylosanthes scabra TaxID=79078 RepID=A0ABU6TGS9_9FABA|nr:hypothetical protein [Stylosanthes scabra]